MNCEICNIPYEQGFTEITTSDNQKKSLCVAHSVDFYVWLSTMQKEEREEYQFEKNDKSPIVILPLAGILLVLTILNRWFIESGFYAKILLFALSVVYIAALCSPSIYPRALRIGYLRGISLQSYRKIRREDIMIIDATVIVGSLVFLTLFSGGDQEQPLGDIALSEVLGINQQELFSLITATTVAIFAFSAVASSIVIDIEVGRRLMVGGFVYLFFMIFLIAL